MTSAPAISRRLKLEGITVVATRNREGVRVTRSLGCVRVSIDFDSGRERRVHALYVGEILAAAGYTVERHEDAETLSFTVTR